MMGWRGVLPDERVDFADFDDFAETADLLLSRES